MTSISASDYRDLAAALEAKKPSKYRNKKTIVDGIEFDSEGEAGRYQHLRLLERQGLIVNLERQKRFPLTYQGALICTYVCDYAYHDVARGTDVVEDWKSKATKTAAFRIKAKLFRAIHGFEISIVMKSTSAPTDHSAGHKKGAASPKRAARKVENNADR